MTNMIEKVARAIWRETYRHDTLIEWHGLKPGQPHHKMTMDAARAAIEAMRKPTDEMLNAGWDKIEEYRDATDPAALAAAWPTMIDSILSEGGE